MASLPHQRREVARDELLPAGNLDVRDAGGAGDGTQPLFRVQERGPSAEQWPTPNPIELVVALQQPGDSPDRLAEFVESLRYGFGHDGEWTSLPAPLFFERVVRDYISGFALADEEEGGADPA